MNEEKLRVHKHLMYQDYVSVCVIDERDDDNHIMVWMDVSIDNHYHDVDCDWNAYIFDLTDERDVKLQEYQEDCDNFMDCEGIVIDYLQEKGLIYQDNKGEWYGNF